MTSAASTRPLLRLFPVLLLNLIAFGISIPIIPALAKGLGASGVEIGLIFAVQALGQFAMAPLWGKLSDKAGRKPILFLTIAAAACVDLLTANASSLWMLFAMRLVAGLCAGNISTASALVTDATTLKTRSKGLALIGICFGLGFTIGPGIGAIAAAQTPQDLGMMGRGFPFVIAGLINAIAAVLALLVLHEPLKEGVARQLNRLSRRPDSIIQMLKRPGIRVMSGFFLSYSLGVTILETTFFLYAAGAYGYDEARIGAIFAGMGLLSALVQGGIGRISAKLGDLNMTFVGALLFGVSIAAAAAWEQITYLLFMLALASIGRALLQPGSLSMMSRQSITESENGKVMGIAQSAQSLGRVVGPAIGGVLFDLVDPRAPFIASGFILSAASFYWFFAIKKVAPFEQESASE